MASTSSPIPIPTPTPIPIPVPASPSPPPSDFSSVSDFDFDDESNLFLDRSESSNRVEIAIAGEYIQQEQENIDNQCVIDKCGGFPDYPSGFSYSPLCSVCRSALRLLVQLSPPMDSLIRWPAMAATAADSLLARSVWIFVCSNSSCQTDSGAWAAVSLSSLTVEPHDPEPAAPPSDDQIPSEFDVLDSEFGAADSAIDMALSNLVESRAAKQPSASSQLSSNKLQSKSIGSQEQTTSDQCWRPFYLAFAAEPPAQSIDSQLAAIREAHRGAIQRLEEELAAEQNAESRSEPDPFTGGTENYESSHRPVDPLFSQFCARLKREPLQLLRYEFGGSPLFPSAADAANFQPGKCERCGRERVFELQLTPALFDPASGGGMFASSTVLVSLVLTVCPDPILCSNGKLDTQYRQFIHEKVSLFVDRDAEVHASQKPSTSSNAASLTVSNV